LGPNSTREGTGGMLLEKEKELGKEGRFCKEESIDGSDRGFGGEEKRGGGAML